jgi:hypothetical protein
MSVEAWTISPVFSWGLITCPESRHNRLYDSSIALQIWGKDLLAATASAISWTISGRYKQSVYNHHETGPQIHKLFILKNVHNLEKNILKFLYRRT